MRWVRGGCLLLFLKEVFQLDFCCVICSPVPLPQWHLALLNAISVRRGFVCLLFYIAFDFCDYVVMGGWMGGVKGCLLQS